MPLRWTLVGAAAALVLAVAPAQAGTPIASRPACDHSYLYHLKGASQAQYRAAVLCLINGARHAEGLPALKRAAPLESVAQGQSDRFARTGSASHGSALTDIGKRFARKGYKPAAYNEAFSVVSGGAAPYDFLVDLTRRAGVPCTEILDPRFRDVGIGVSDGAGGQVTTLAIELGRRVGTSQPSSNTRAAATCGHKVPPALVSGPVVDVSGAPVLPATTMTADLVCRAKLTCTFTTAAELPDARATTPAQPVTLAAGRTQSVTFTFDPAALAAERAAARPSVTIHLTVTAPAEYVDAVSGPLG